MKSPSQVPRSLVALASLFALAATACDSTEPERAASVLAVAGSVQPGVVSTALVHPIVFEARTAAGAALPGVPLTATVAGGGSVTPSSAVTGSDGRASFQWTLGPVVGNQVLSVIAAGVATAATVQISAAPPPVATVEVTLEEATVLQYEMTVAQATLRSAAGESLAGRSVIWTSSDTTVAQVIGEGATGYVYTMGAGTAQITASSEGKSAARTLTVQPVCTFGNAVPLAYGSSVTGALATSDCRIHPAAYADYYRVVVPSTRVVQVKAASPGFSATVALLGANDQFHGLDIADAPGDSASVVAFLPAGTYYAVVTANLDWMGPAALGSYTLTVGDAPPEAAVCVWQIAPVIGVPSTTNGELTASDCDAGDGSYVDYYRVIATTTTTARITLTSAHFVPFLAVLGEETGYFDATFNTLSGSTATLDVPLRPGTWYIAATSRDGGQKGAYQLSVTEGVSVHLESAPRTAPTAARGMTELFRRSPDPAAFSRIFRR